VRCWGGWVLVVRSIVLLLKMVAVVSEKWTVVGKGGAD
jgi:hypothetical protein